MNFLISCVGAYGDSGIGTGGFVLHAYGKAVVIDKYDTTGLYKFKSNYFRFNRATKMLIGYNQNGIFYRCDFPKVNDCHDIYVNEQGVYFVSTGNNKVLYYNFLGDLIETIEFNGEGDAWHLNCLTFNDDNYFISAFGEFSKHREWNTQGCKEKGLLVNLNTKKVVFSGLSGPHTPRFIDDKCFICNSHEKTLRIIETGGDYLDINLHGFTRGLTYDDNNVYVGVSADRKSNNPTASRIVILDRNDYSILDEIKIPFPEIYDIVLCDENTSNNIISNISKFQINSKNELIDSLTKQVEIGHQSNLKLQATIDSLRKKNNLINRIIRKIRR